jgi:hypothetical protein
MPSFEVEQVDAETRNGNGTNPSIPSPPEATDPSVSPPPEATNPPEATPPGGTNPPDETNPPEATNPPETTPPGGTTPPGETAPPEATTPPDGTPPPDGTNPPEATTPPETTPPDGTPPPDGTNPPEATNPPETPPSDGTAPPEATTPPGETPPPEGTEQEVFEVESGRTSVFLDDSVLASANLNLTQTDAAEANTEGFPEGEPAVGFEITPETDFTFTQENGFTPVDGTIEHSGSLTFEGLGTVGDFSIGFDPSRDTDTTSGFFVADTLDTDAILFDLGDPQTANFDGENLTIAGSDLLVSPEFASLLGNQSLAGTDIGGARIDAVAQPDDPLADAVREFADSLTDAEIPQETIDAITNSIEDFVSRAVADAVGEDGTDGSAPSPPETPPSDGTTPPEASEPPETPPSDGATPPETPPSDGTAPPEATTPPGETPPSEGTEREVFEVESGRTSVFLDDSVLASANLNLTQTDAAEANTEGFPEGEPAVGFDIRPETDFTFTQENGFTPVAGTIQHSGSLTFEGVGTVGNFSIGFDPSRDTDTTSGFFIADTLDTDAILFDLSDPQTANFDGNNLTIAGTDLLVSSEFASLLGNQSLAGTDIGGARIDAVAGISRSGGSGATDPISGSTEPISGSNDSVNVTFGTLP